MKRWIKNKFDGCPVAPNETVEIRFRSGVRIKGVAGDWFWKRHETPAHEIVDYRQYDSSSTLTGSL